jgi:hypothetical protein
MGASAIHAQSSKTGIDAPKKVNDRQKMLAQIFHTSEHLNRFDWVDAVPKLE